MAISAIKVNFVEIVPQNPASVPNGCLFLDSTNGNAPTVKTTGGGLEPTGSGATNYFVKQMIAGAAFSANVPVSKRSDGKIVAADSDAPNGMNHIGYSLGSSAGDGSSVNVLLAGANLAGALTSLGFSTGDEIFLSETGGYTNNPNSFTGNDDRIIRLGIADCAASIASSTATDLIAFTEVMINP